MRSMIAWLVTALMVVAVVCSRSEGAQIGEAPPVNPEVPRITANEARKLFGEGKLILANAHERGAEFEKTELIGAISMPNGEVQRTNPELPENVIVAFYCM
ncbi:exported hypothetical protein [Candidatus Sulfobium mesophilum]|uniref:Rhodanese domain-containing protein n=1 Tax=Candidatus Sulfobium mesophilum TaxID=2016548 RepID=A0A2U3QDQ4_9BACT|nr:exported hypothetical protein [Candidatus Sulfobium mesophilum]